MKILNLIQGSQEWLESRLSFFCASEAPAVMGESKYMSRNQLLDLKKGWKSNPVSSFTQKLFDDGHEHEDMAREITELEELEEFPPVVGSTVVDGIELLASFDGFGDGGAWEHKDWNKTLAENVRNGVLEPHYYWQLEHQCIVAGIDEVMFTCSDGTEDNRVSMIYKSVPDRRKKLVAAWKQFDEDLESHELKAKETSVAAEVIQDLPAISYKMNGLSLNSNLSEYKAKALDLVEQSKKKLETDQDFANAESMVKVFKSAEDKLSLMSQQVLGEVESIDTFVKDLGFISENIRQARLALDKQVKSRKEEIKTELVMKAKAEIQELVSEASAKYNVAFSVKSDFAAAIKGKRNIESMRSAINDEIASAKVFLSEQKDAVQANLDVVNEHKEYRFLFNDWGQIAFKPKEDFETLVKLRISEHKEKEEKRLAEERERIRREEEEKAQREAQEKAKREEAEKLACSSNGSIAEAQRLGKAKSQLTHEVVQQSTTQPSRLDQARQVMQQAETAPVAYVERAERSDEMISLSVKEYNELLRKADLLDALYAAGVDNWDGYSEAMEMIAE
ncbi:YqaJ viral recombinase family protein [Vibrio paracholerae]|uniref:YqaJ viral recombinase family protein n=1 Tax=Vibrio paracholerae TaxID=650003 RepID=UPI0020962E97|nr:YqaJ viral recombinase family protein [Vibrio paracholerae]MCO7020931.1 homogentisate 1,2-dioxygenase [Vibrio paracholerae]